jgi:polysaccharide export outer membrane protein
VVLPGEASPSPSAAAPDRSTLVKPGDTLDVSVFGHPELSRVGSVQPDGAVSLPFLGRVVAKGRTVDDIGREIAGALERDYNLRDPRVSVAVASFGVRSVFVLGRVRQSGSHEISLNRPLSLLQLVSLSGGFQEDADRSRILIQRLREDGTRVVFTVDLTGVERSGDLRNDRLLQDGDTVVVPRAEEVSVLGQVNRPGSFVMRADRPLTLLRAIAEAEGFTRLARPAAIVWMRKSPSGVLTATVDADAILAGDGEDPPVEPGDVLFVPERAW